MKFSIKTISMLMIALAISACSSKSNNNNSTEAKVETSEIAKGTLTVYSLHTNQRCITCKSIEKLTQEVVSELNNEKINLKVLNISEKQNKKIADKYEATWSSLVLDNGKVANNVTKMAFSYAKNQPEVFKKHLKSEIEKML